jgi:hypothetical protein
MTKMTEEALKARAAKAAATRARNKAGVELDLQLKDFDDRNITPALTAKLESILGNQTLSSQLAAVLTDPRRGDESLFSWCVEWTAKQGNGLEVEDVGAILRALVTRNSPVKSLILSEAKRLRLVAEKP